jgi:hypothetical protein
MCCGRKDVFYVDVLTKFSLDKTFPDSVRHSDLLLNQHVSGYSGIKPYDILPQGRKKAGGFGNKSTLEVIH